MAKKSGEEAKGALPPKKASALKRNLQSLKQRERRRSFKSKIRTALNALGEAIESKQKEAIVAKIKLVHSLADKAANKKIFKKNQAARVKARSTKKALGQS